MNLQVLITLILPLACFNNLYGQEHLDTWDFNVRISDGAGGWTDKLGVIDLRNPDKEDATGHGTVRRFSKTNGTKVDCNGDKYGYDVVSLDTIWIGTLKSDPTVIVGPADAQRFWDDVYKDYEKLTDLDVSRNCHGYSFGVKDWPQTATGPLGLGPFAFGSGKSPCYYLAQTKNATVAVDVTRVADKLLYGLQHSIKVVGHECPLPPGPPVPIGPVTLPQKLKESKEQFRFSGTYRQTADCPDSVKLENNRLTANLGFKLFRPK